MDEADIREFLAGEYRRLVAAFSVIGGSRAAAEDAVQEALARAWERDQRGQPIHALAVWVAVVARNILRSGLRRLLVERRAKAWLAQDLAARASEVRSAGDLADVLRAVAALPRQQREAIALHYFAGLSLAEAAQVVGSTEGAVKALLHRARRSLAQKLVGYDVEGSGEVQGVAGPG